MQTWRACPWKERGVGTDSLTAVATSTSVARDSVTYAAPSHDLLPAADNMHGWAGVIWVLRPVPRTTAAAHDPAIVASLPGGERAGAGGEGARMAEGGGGDDGGVAGVGAGVLGGVVGGGEGG